MGTSKRIRPRVMQAVFYVSIAFGLFGGIFGFPSPPEDDRFLDREFASPGGHQLASWLISQLRKGDYPVAQAAPVSPFRLPLSSGKRNSEMTSSIMGIPRTMIDNGR